MQKQLDMEAGKQIIEAIGRIAQIAGSNALDKNAEAEVHGLTEYLKNQLFAHAGHLMGCWFAVKNEYEPLCNAFASIANRADGIQRQRRAAEEQSTKPEEPKAQVNEMAKTEGESDLVAPPGAPLVLTPNFKGKWKRR